MYPEALVLGAGAGAIWGAIGAGSAVSKPVKAKREAFNPAKYGKSILIGALVGLVAAYKGMPIDAAATAYLVPITAVVQKGIEIGRNILALLRQRIGI